MFEGLFEYLGARSIAQLARDALDIFIVYYVLYRALLVLRGTRAMQVGLGLAMVFLVYVLAQLLQLVTVLSILGTLIQSIILVVVVVFQNDIRRGLQRVGSRAWFGSLARAQESRVIDEVVDAATELARHRIGAIITFEQDANLDEFVGTHKGHEIDAKVTQELLVSLFIPEGTNKLHDGAVVIRNLRIAKAGVFFPMPESRVVDASFGSRHRAALGITEETDAVVVVVSEERGTISFCFNGNIASNLDGPKLRTMLEAIFSPKVRKKSRKAQQARRVSETPTAPPVESKPTSRDTTDRKSAFKGIEPEVRATRTGAQPSEADTSQRITKPSAIPEGDVRITVLPETETVKGPSEPEVPPTPLRKRPSADETPLNRASAAPTSTPVPATISKPRLMPRSGEDTDDGDASGSESLADSEDDEHDEHDEHDDSDRESADLEAASSSSSDLKKSGDELSADSEHGRGPTS